MEHNQSHFSFTDHNGCQKMWSFNSSDAWFVANLMNELMYERNRANNFQDILNRIALAIEDDWWSDQRT